MRTRAVFRVCPSTVEVLTPTCGFPQFLEKFLVEYKSHTTDFFHFGFCCCISVNKIRCNGNGQFATEFFPTKSWEAGKKFSEVTKAGRRSRKFTSNRRNRRGSDEDVGECGRWESREIEGSSPLSGSKVSTSQSLPNPARCQSHPQLTHTWKSDRPEKHLVRGSVCLSKSGLDLQCPRLTRAWLPAPREVPDSQLVGPAVHQHRQGPEEGSQEWGL